MARDVMAVRLDRPTRRRLQAAATRRRLTPSAATRAALEDWLEAEERSEDGRPYEAMVDLVGCVRGGDRLRSSRGARWILRGAPARASGGAAVILVDAGADGGVGGRFGSAPRTVRGGAARAAGADGDGVARGDGGSRPARRTCRAGRTRCWRCCGEASCASCRSARRTSRASRSSWRSTGTGAWASRMRRWFGWRSGTASIACSRGPPRLRGVSDRERESRSGSYRRGGTEGRRR